MSFIDRHPLAALVAFLFFVLVVFAIMLPSCSCADDSPICDACRADCIDAPDVAACEKGCSDVCSSCSREEEIWGERR